jgi:predicted flap endonuclease-1-like 5' DNA nuclease
MDTTTSAQHSTASIDLMGSITIVHIVLMIILAAAAILVIWWGSVLRRRRRQADHDVAENREMAEEAGATAPPAPESPMGSDVPPTPALERAAPEPEPAIVPVAVPAREPEPEPVATAQPAPEVVMVPAPIADVPAQGPSGASELTQLKGLGPKLATTLGELGYTRVDQIADLTPAEAEALDARLGTFQGRMARDRWIEQARLLTAGDRAGYEAAFGKL